MKIPALFTDSGALPMLYFKDDEDGQTDSQLRHRAWKEWLETGYQSTACYSPPRRYGLAPIGTGLIVPIFYSRTGV